MALNVMLKARSRTTVSVYWSVLSVRAQSIICDCIVLGKMCGGITFQIEWLLMDQSQKSLRQSKIPDFFAAK